MPVDYFYRPGALRNRGGKPAVQVSRVQGGTITGEPYQVGFTLPVSVSGDPTIYHLFIDFGSHLTWVEDKRAKPKKPYKYAGHNIQTQYGDATVLRGHSQITDMHYKTRPTETVLRHLIGIGHLYINYASGPIHTSQMGDGMIGLSPSDGSRDYVKALTHSGNKTQEKKYARDIETVVSALRDEAIIGVFFTPLGVQRQAQITFKGVNDRKFLRGHQPVYTPVVNKSSGHWNFKQTMKYGTRALAGSTGVTTMIDSGYAFINLTKSGFAEYKKKTGAVEKQGLLVLNAAQYQRLESLWFTMNGWDFEITKDAQLWPRSQNRLEEFDVDDYVLCIGNSGDTTMVFGLAWCECLSPSSLCYKIKLLIVR